MNTKVFIVLAMVLTVCFSSPVDDDESYPRERRQFGFGYPGYGGSGGGVANAQSTAINNGPGGVANSNANALNNGGGGYGGYGGYGK